MMQGVLLVIDMLGRTIDDLRRELEQSNSIVSSQAEELANLRAILGHTQPEGELDGR